jgi:hypothetical protein
LKISGHKTRDVFDRYNIVSGKDLADAAAKLALSQRQAKIATAQEEQRVAIQQCRLAGGCDFVSHGSILLYAKVIVLSKDAGARSFQARKQLGISDVQL